MSQITFVTSNPTKADQMSWHTGLRFEHASLKLDEIQSLDIAEVIEHKARAAYAAVGSPVLVEDNELTMHALGRLPGPLIKWFFEEIGCDGLCSLLGGSAERTATAATVFGYYDGKSLQTFRGEIRGRIAEKPRGTIYFGWDPIFIPDGMSKTWGEMTKKEQIATSMRRKAIKKLEQFLTHES